MSIELARRWGVKNMVSETLRENHAMIRVLKRCRFTVEEKTGNMFTLSLKLE
jgi:RimJ/RimL family protein N-acetyltransferase